jgi:hypothetical protein
MSKTLRIVLNVFIVLGLAWLVVDAFAGEPYKAQQFKITFTIENMTLKEAAELEEHLTKKLGKAVEIGVVKQPEVVDRLNWYWGGSNTLQLNSGTIVVLDSSSVGIK